MEQTKQTSLPSVWRVLVLVLLAAMFTLMSLQTTDAVAAEPSESTVESVGEDADTGSSLLTTLKQIAILAVIPMTLVGMGYGARRLRGAPAKRKRPVKQQTTEVPRAESRHTVAPPPSRTRSRSAMRQVRRLKKK